jgi:hypothetical protein
MHFDSSRVRRGMLISLLTLAIAIGAMFTLRQRSLRSRDDPVGPRV